MKKNSKIILYVMSLLMLLNISATPITPSTFSDNAISPNIQIERLTDGTSVISFDAEQEHGFKFITPDGWYPISLPSTSEEIEEFKKVVAENNLPLSEEWITSRLSSDDDNTIKLTAVDLNSSHYQDGSKAIIIALGCFEIPKSTPNWALKTIISSLSSLYAGEITNVSYEEIDNQLVGTLEFSIPDEDITLYGKMFLFIRNGKLVILAGATVNEELSSETNDVMDSIFDSLDFDIEQ